MARQRQKVQLCLLRRIGRCKGSGQPKAIEHNQEQASKKQRHCWSQASPQDRVTHGIIGLQNQKFRRLAGRQTLHGVGCPRTRKSRLFLQMFLSCRQCLAAALYQGRRLGLPGFFCSLIEYGSSISSLRLYR